MAPERTCIGCRARAPQASLLRLAWDATAGSVVADPARRIPGRGAYLHPGCTALGGRQLGRALRRGLDPRQVSRVLADLASTMATAPRA